MPVCPEWLLQEAKAEWKPAIPDFIHVGFGVSIKGKSDNEIDALMLVPHLGVFMVEVIHGLISYEAGKLMGKNRTGFSRELRFRERTRHNRYEMIQFLRDKYGITPLVHTIYFFPDISGSTERNILEDNLGTVLFGSDLVDEITFMKRIFDAYLADQRQYLGKDWDGSIRYADELDDCLCNEIIQEWGFTEHIHRPDNPPLLFLSYCSKDKQYAFKLKQSLERKGIFVWRAPEDVPLGEYYKEHEVNALIKCDAVLLLLSTDSQSSEEVWFEVETALKEKKKILPIIIDGEITPKYLQALKCHEWREMHTIDDDMIDEIIMAMKKK